MQLLAIFSLLIFFARINNVNLRKNDYLCALVQRDNGRGGIKTDIKTGVKMGVKTDIKTDIKTGVKTVGL